jgi:tight adherence protein C
VLLTAWLSLGVYRVIAADDTLEVIEARADSFPRVVARVKVSTDEIPPLDSLGPGQLTVLENGRPSPTVDFFQIRSPQTPASVVLTLDVSGSMADENRLPQAREAAKGFLNQMRTNDRVGLVSFSNEVTVRSGFTTDRRQTAKVIDGLTPGGDTRLYDALIRAVGQAAATPGETRAVVLLTDGEDTRSSASLDEAIALAIRSGVPVYAIGLGNEIQTGVLQRIASETGGRFYHAPAASDLGQAFRLISRQIASQYEIYWVSRGREPAGSEIPVEIRVASRSGTPAVASFTYRVPAYSRLQPTTMSIGGNLGVVGQTEAPSEEQGVILGLLAGMAVTLIWAGYVAPRARRYLDARLATFVGGERAAVRAATEIGGLATRHVEVSPLTSASARLVARLLPVRQLQRLRRMLTQAGLPTERHLRLFLAAQLALATLLGSVGYLIVRSRALDGRQSIIGFLLVVVLAILGFYLPYMWLRRRIVRRQAAILRALPDGLDLMAIGVSAGLSLDGAMLEVVDRWEGELSRELNQVLNEIRMGAGRRQALLNLVERTQLEDIRLIIAALIQAEELGSNVSTTLTIQAEQLRIRRRQQAEEQARKAPVKMLLPLVFLIFPGIFVVILGPSVLQIYRTLRGVINGL